MTSYVLSGLQDYATHSTKLRSNVYLEDGDQKTGM